MSMYAHVHVALDGTVCVGVLVDVDVVVLFFGLLGVEVIVVLVMDNDIINIFSLDGVENINEKLQFP